MNRFLLLSILLLFSISSCSSRRRNLILPPIGITVNNSNHSEIYVIIDYDKSNNIFKNAKPTVLNDKELSNIERILEDAVSQYNLFPKNHLDLNKYKKQIIPIINKFGEKEVWINCFCQYNENWKTEIIRVDDGGDCYFNLKINLTKSKYYDFFVNGRA